MDVSHSEDNREMMYLGKIFQTLSGNVPVKFS